MTTKTEFEALKAEIERQKALLQKLHDQLNPKPFVPMPHQPPDYTGGMTAANMMDRATLQAMAAADDPRGRSADLQAFQQQQRQRSAPAEPQRPRGSGWVEPRPIESPPCVAIADQLVDAQDKLDLIERAREFSKVAAVEQASKDKA
jgi:hypothetical protein